MLVYIWSPLTWTSSSSWFSAEYYNQFDENVQIQQYHQQIRNQYAQQSAKQTGAVAVPQDLTTHLSQPCTQPDTQFAELQALGQC